MARICNVCGGGRTLRCPKCNGGGTTSMPGLLWLTTNHAKCGHCNASGRRTCPKCDGEGLVAR